MVAIVVVFQAISPNGLYLSAVNLVNLFQQSAVIMVLAMGEGFALVLGEIDLSVGFVGACGAAITVQLVQPVTTRWPWWAAILAGLAFCAVFGAIQGTLITRLRLPSFIVTLGGYLIANGLFLIILNFGPFSGFPLLAGSDARSEEHTSELQSHVNLVCRLLLEKKKNRTSASAWYAW